MVSSGERFTGDAGAEQVFLLSNVGGQVKVNDLLCLARQFLNLVSSSNLSTFVTLTVVKEGVFLDECVLEERSFSLSSLPNEVFSKRDP